MPLFSSSPSSFSSLALLSLSPYFFFFTLSIFFFFFFFPFFFSSFFSSFTFSSPSSYFFFFFSSSSFFLSPSFTSLSFSSDILDGKQIIGVCECTNKYKIARLLRHNGKMNETCRGNHPVNRELTKCSAYY